MKILIVFPLFVYPEATGGTIRVVEFSRFLSERHDVSIVCFSHDKDQPHLAAAEKMKDFCATFHVIPHGPILVRSHFWHFLFNRRPTWVYAFNSETMAKKIQRIIAEQDIELVHIEFSMMGQYIRYVDTSKCATVLAELELKSRSLEINFSYHWPSFYALRLWYQMIKCRRYEEDVFPKFDKIFTINGIEKQLLLEKNPGLDVDVFPFGVNTETFRLAPVQELPESMAFLGDFSHYPNEDGLIWFVNKVLPSITKEIPNCTFYIIGPNLKKSFKRRQSTNKNIKIMGYVNDLRDFLSRIQVFVNPILTGGGVRTKLLVSMALQRPVVSTSLGLEGIAAVPGKHAFVADDPDLFAHQVIQLLHTSDLRKQMGTNARKMIEDTQSTTKVFKEIEKIYEELIDRKRSGIDPMKKAKK